MGEEIMEVPYRRAYQCPNEASQISADMSEKEKQIRFRFTVFMLLIGVILTTLESIFAMKLVVLFYTNVPEELFFILTLVFFFLPSLLSAVFVDKFRPFPTFLNIIHLRIVYESLYCLFSEHELLYTKATSAEDETEQPRTVDHRRLLNLLIFFQMTFGSVFMAIYQIFVYLSVGLQRQEHIDLEDVDISLALGVISMLVVIWALFKLVIDEPVLFDDSVSFRGPVRCFILLCFISADVIVRTIAAAAFGAQFGVYAILAAVLVISNRTILGCYCSDLWVLMTLLTGDATSFMMLPRDSLWILHGIAFFEGALNIILIGFVPAKAPGTHTMGLDMDPKITILIVVAVALVFKGLCFYVLVARKGIQARGPDILAQYASNVVHEDISDSTSNQ